MSDKPHELAQWIRDGIESGDYAPGSRVPSHRDLASLYGVSTETASNAVQLLIAEGLLVSGQRHEGTFVAFVKVIP